MFGLFNNVGEQNKHETSTINPIPYSAAMPSYNIYPCDHIPTQYTSIKMSHSFVKQCSINKIPTIGLEPFDGGVGTSLCFPSGCFPVFLFFFSQKSEACVGNPRLSFANKHIRHCLACYYMLVTADGWMIDRVHHCLSIYVMIGSPHA